jgi:adenylyltransferase/sulfurtransferase
MTSLPALSETQIRRYARHIVLAEIGGIGQSKLIAAKVLVVGAGGLGAPLLQYLAAAGIGTLGVIDHDTVDLSNLQRQVIHRTGDVGMTKVESARRALLEINHEVTVIPHGERLTEANAERIIAGYDVVADGSDNFATRYLLNDTCHRLKKTLVAAAILRFDGQISTYKA